MKRLNINPVTIIVLLIAFCGSIGAEGEKSASIPPVSQDLRIASLLPRYARFPYPAPEIKTADDLPAALQTMVKSGQTQLLDELGKTCRALLFPQAATYDLPIDLFRDYPANPPAEQLRERLDMTWGYLKITQGVIADLNSFLDWFSDDDWHLRFGATGFYQRLQQFDREVRFLLAVYWYYQARVQPFTSSSVDPSGKRDELVKNLKQSFETLKRYLADSNQKPDGLLVLKLWYIRLGRVLAGYEPAYYEAARRQLELVLKSPLDPERQYGFRLESLRCALAAPAIRVSELETLILQVHQLRGWLQLNQYAVLQSKSKFLELAFFECALHQKRRMLTISLRRLRERAYLSDRTYLQPLIDLAGRETEFHSLIRQMLAARLAASVQTLEKSKEKDWVNLLRGGTDFELLCLARYYRNQNPPELEKAQSVYEIFIKTRSPVHEKMPEVLYDTALCCYQLAQPEEKNQVQAGNLGHLVKAIYYWNRLARKFGQWSDKTDPQHVNAYQALLQSAACAYRLSNEYPAQYGELARETLAILVGRFSSAGSEPSGSFAATPAAQSYRYYYALLLFTLHQYDQAADWFGAVPRDDPRRNAACYYAIRCRYQQLPPNRKNHDEKWQRHQNWIDELETLLKEKLPDALGDQAVTLLIQLYQDLEQTDSALQALTRTLRQNRNQPQWITLALKILQEQRQILLQLHAGANPVELSNKLAITLPAAQTVYEILQSEPATGSQSPGQQKFSATRNYLEQLCLAAITRADNQGTLPLPSLRDLIGQADKITASLKNNPSYANQVWFVRCRALLAFGQVEFEQSRQLWHQIRSAAAAKKDVQSKYLWWESRYFSLRCLIRLNRAEEAEHVIEVLLRSHPNETTPWTTRLKNLQEELRKED